MHLKAGGIQPERGDTVMQHCGEKCAVQFEILDRVFELPVGSFESLGVIRVPGNKRLWGMLCGL